MVKSWYDEKKTEFYLQIPFFFFFCTQFFKKIRIWTLKKKIQNLYDIKV